MSTDATTPVPVAPGHSALPQFDATREVPTEVTREIPAADTAALPTASPQPSPIAPPQVPYTYATPHPAPEDRTGAAAQVPAGQGATPLAAPPTGPRGESPRWSAKKTAVTAGLAIVLATIGAIGAAAAMPAGSRGGDTARFGRGLGPGGQQGFSPFGRGNQGFGNQNGQGFGPQNGQQGQQGLNNQGSQLPNLGNIDPNQLSQLDPQDLLQQLNQLIGASTDGSSGSTT